MMKVADKYRRERQGLLRKMYSKEGRRQMEVDDDTWTCVPTNLSSRGLINVFL